MTPDILVEIFRWTNVKLGKLRSKYIRENRPELHDMDITKLVTFFVFLMYSAVFKSNHESCEYIFATDGTGRDIFSCVMSQNRFLNVLQCLGFDNGADREDGKQNDNS